LWYQHTFSGPRSKVVKHYKNSELASFATENLTLGRQIFKMKKGAQDELGWMAPFKFVGFRFLRLLPAPQSKWREVKNA
jgi:galactokinase/mevalonate kinase-like predicted kinase